MQFTTATIALFALFSATAVTAVPVVSSEATVGNSTSPPDIIEYLRGLSENDSALARRAGPWIYYRGANNGLGRDQALQEERTFTRLFGGASLTAASGQCYVSRCRGNDYTFCNIAGNNRKETIANRLQAADSYRNRNNNWMASWASNDIYKFYTFGKQDSWRYNNAAIRRC